MTYAQLIISFEMKGRLRRKYEESYCTVKKLGKQSFCLKDKDLFVYALRNTW